MQADRDQIERGMALAAELPDIMPGQAGARIKLIHEDIQHTLRAPLSRRPSQSDLPHGPILIVFLGSSVTSRVSRPFLSIAGVGVSRLGRRASCSPNRRRKWCVARPSRSAGRRRIASVGSKKMLAEAHPILLKLRMPMSRGNASDRTQHHIVSCTRPVS